MSGPDSNAVNEARAAWLEAVSRALKGGDFERKLVSRTADGIRIEPLYGEADNAPIAGRGAKRWIVAQRMDHSDPEGANAQALTDLENGASGLVLVLAGAATARGFGTRIDDARDLDLALSGVHLDLIHLRLELPPFDGQRLARGVLELVARRTLEPSALSVDLGLDPLGDMARAGGAPAPPQDLLADAALIACDAVSAGLGGTVLRADGRAVHEAGGSEVQELAFALGSLVAYLRALEQAGLSLEEARTRLSVTLAVDADEYLSVAKLRAMRRLWGRVEEACGLEPRPLALHAETAWRSLTQRDPWVNLLRGTMGTFCAAIGGADSVAVLPFTAAIGLADGFARRLARNTQLVLAEEAHLWRVADPAAGAGAFEALTEDLAARAWSLFQQMERDGGLAAVLQSGALQRDIAEIRAARERAVARRQDAITGTSEFPHLSELPVAVLDVAPTWQEPRAARVTFGRLTPHRLAEPFEALRDRSDDFLALHGMRPRIFLANLGMPASFTARATFARNLFEAGGIEAVSSDGFGDVRALAQAWRASGASLACLCGDDDSYFNAEGGIGIPAAAALKQAGVAGLYLAGRPGEHEAGLRQAGVDGFAFVGCDALEILRAAHRAAEHDEPVG